MKKLTLAAVAAMTAFVATPASAAELLGGGCAGDLSFTGGSTLITCYGRLTGNTLNNSPAGNAANNAALDALGYLGPDIAFNAIPAGNKLDLSSPAGAILDFPGVLNGIIFVGIHAGNAAGGVGNTTSFYKINAVDLDTFTFNPPGASGGTLFTVIQSSVPEPTTWALMILGFGAIGFALRRRDRDARIRVAYS